MSQVFEEIQISSNNKHKWTRREGNFSFLIEKLKNSRGEFLKVARTDENRARNKALFISRGKHNYGWLRFQELFNRLVGKVHIHQQQIPLIKDFPPCISITNPRTRPARTFVCTTYGTISWNQVAREIAVKLKWKRYLQLSVLNDNMANFNASNNQESCWKPIKWKYKDTFIEVKRWIDEDITINERSLSLTQNFGLKITLISLVML